MALKAIRKYSKVPAVVTFAMHQEELTRDGLTRRRPASAWKGPGRMSSGSTATVDLRP